MRYLEEKKSNISTLIENQFPLFVQQNNPKFISFLASYYESLENKYQPLDLASNLIDYYNIGYYRQNQLVKSTKTVGILFASSTEITVQDTTGFPAENGYIKIDNEIIFYRSIENNTFVGCERGTSALILQNIPKSEIVLTSSTAEEHDSDSIVENIAYSYANEFFSRIKLEIAPLITENVIQELNYTQFLKSIKSFYSAKGSLNGHRIIFRILFNDKKVNILLKPRGSGAKLKINNYNKFIPKDPPPQIVSGGSGYDNRRDPITNKLINSPIVDIIGSGTGEVKSSGLRPNNTAVVSVTEINNTGTITKVEVEDPGDGYIGPIRSRVRPRSFIQDQRVYNSTETGYGRVEYWDGFRNELVLYDVIGYFRPDDEIIGVGDEEPRAFVSRAFIGTTSIRSGVEIEPEIQNIEFPRDYTFKTSNSQYLDKRVLKCKYLRGGEITSYNTLPDTLTLKQDEDVLFGVSGVSIDVDNIVSLRDNTYEFDISSNSLSRLENIYLPPSTEIGIEQTFSGSNFIVTVDDCSRFPLTNGIFFINNSLIEYSHRSNTQFFDCKFVDGDSVTVGLGDSVVSWGRKKYTLEWEINQTINIGEFRYYKDNLYKATSSGVTSTLNGPTHTFGVKRDGLYEDGNLNPVSWEYVGKNTLRHSLYVEPTNDKLTETEFELIAVPGEVIIVDGGSLHTNQQYEFVTLESPNTQTFAFTTPEISDRLASILSKNYNTNFVVSDNRLPGYGSLYGFNSIYDFDDYIYVPTSTIPRWWNEIVDLSNPNLSSEEIKKVSFTNQKLITRYNKSTLIYETRVITDVVSTKKSVAFNADAVQVNSYKGNTINYGRINSFIIGSGGDYKVPCNGNQFNEQNFPSFTITNNDQSSIDVSNKNTPLIKLSSKFTKINFNKLAELWTGGELSGFTTAPIIEIINNNPKKNVSFNLTDISVVNNTFDITYNTSVDLQLDTGDRVYYTSTNPGTLLSLKNETYYYIAKISETSSHPKVVTYSLHLNESDSILKTNKISLNYIDTTSTVTVSLLGDQLNPISFKPAEFDLSYNEYTGSIDNIVIRDSGDGYISAPTIRIIGGGKLELPGSEIIIPYNIGSEEIIEMRGELISFTNYYKENYYEIIDFQSVGQEDYSLAPKISVDSGSEAEAIAYVSGGKISSVIPIKLGKNYNTVPRVEIIGSDGSGKNAVVQANIENGQVVSYDIINPGEGYKVPVTINIIPNGSGAIVSSKLKEWTFNLVERLSKINRIDDFGGYVYDSSDYNTSSGTPSSENPLNLIHIDPDNDLAPSIDSKQYLLLTCSNKLISKYTIEQRGNILSVLYPNQTFGYSSEQEIAETLSTSVHGPVVAVSYDGVPVYGSNGHSIRYDLSSSITPLKSRYKLKYSTVDNGGVPIFVNGTTYYLKRDGGPSVSEYPIGSFIEDYEYVAGDVNSLDIHNGRFCVTPEYPSGRYCYFITAESFDDVTNEIIEIISGSSKVFGGFPYVVGDSYASVPDTYPNKLCRTNDKIPKVFDRSFEKEIPAFTANGIQFPAIPKNPRFPKENRNNDITICKSSSLSPGSVESVIVENSGNNYRISDKLVIDNSRTSGYGFGGFVSKVRGKDISTFIVDENTIKVQTFTSHGLSVNDFVYFDYIQPQNPIVINLYDSSFNTTISRIKQSEDLSITYGVQFFNKKFYSIFLNSKFKYKLNIPNLPYSFTLDINKDNEYFVQPLEGKTIDSTSIKFDASTVPSLLYLHIGDYIYEINTNRHFSSEYRITSVDTIYNEFEIHVNEDISNYETMNIFYTTKSAGAMGPIAEISVSSGGFNYKKLPSIVSVTSESGTGAILQADSSTIGSIRNISYLTSGGGFTSNLNTKYYLDLPSTAKIVNNFEIYEVEVIDGGSGYDDLLTVLVDGKSDIAEFNVTVQIGVITSIQVLDGGSNLDSLPNITVISSTGSGAVLQPKIRRKQLFSGEEITSPSNSLVFPVTVAAKSLNFDADSSTIEFDQYTGQFKNGDLIYTSDGKKYGNITRIRKPTAYSKVHSYIELDKTKSDVSGNTSEFLQKITDSNVYQDWSYIISSSRDTNEWRDEILTNTHPSGHKLFGKKLIERRKSLFKNPEDVFKTSIIFTAKLVNDILLKAKLSPCKEQVIAIVNPENFSVGDYIFGSETSSVGRIEEITEYTLKVLLYSDSKFIFGENITIVPIPFAYGIESATFKSLVFWNGILQEPDYSYESSYNYKNLSFQIVDKLIPKFDISDTDEVVHYKIVGSKFLLIVNDKIVDSATAQNCLVYRNGVYQYSGTDYIIADNSNGESTIEFTTLVATNETIFIQLFDTTNNYENITNNFNQLSSTVIQSNSNLDQNNILLIYIDGILQDSDAWTLDLNLNQIIFDEPIFGQFNVLEIKNSSVVLNELTTSNTSVYSLNNVSVSPDSLLVSLDGIIQVPGESYDVVGNSIVFKENVADNVYLTVIDGSGANLVTVNKLNSSDAFVPIDSTTIDGTSKSFYPSINGSGITVTQNFLDKTIISLAGIVQNPKTLTINSTENAIVFNEFSGYSSRLFGVTSDYLSVITFTGNSSGTTFTMNKTSVDDCQLLIFYSGVGQSHLLTDFTVSGNNITFSETLDIDKIFGWYIDLSVECVKESPSNIFDGNITGVWNCSTKNITEFIESNFVKNPVSQYEIRKEYLDGTIYQDTDGVTLKGFNTKFTYTSPEYSKSFVEVLNKIEFDGVTKSFVMSRMDNIPYTPSIGKDSLMVYINNQVLDVGDYSVSGNVIYFKNVYSTSDNCTIIDFNSNYYANDSGSGSRDLDRLDVKHDGIRKTFNLSDRGVPQYIKNIGDVFAIRSGVLQRPDQRHQSLSGNKIIFNDAPEFEDTTDLIWFNRQLSPFVTKNIVLDDFYCFDGERTSFPLTLDGLNFYPDNILNLFVVRHGVYQKPGIDYRLGTTSDVITPPGGIDEYQLDGSHIVFSEAPDEGENIIVFYSYDGLNQNVKLDNFKYFNGQETTFALTKNYVSTSPVTPDHIQVYRNGVYQYSGTDYTVEVTNGGPRIIFSQAPLENDEIFITQFNTSNNFKVKTSDFVQTSSTVITNTGGSISESDIILLYRNGILISDGWTFNSVDQTITFVEPVTIDSSVRIFAVSNSLGKIDKFFKIDGIQTTFPLTKDLLSKAPHSDAHMQVYRNGVIQTYSTDYTIETTNGGPRIVFTTAPLQSDKIFITNFGTSTDLIDATSSFTQQSPTEFQHVGPLGQNDFLMIFIDGIIQVGSSFSYNTSTNVLTFSDQIINQTIKIYRIASEVGRLDKFYHLDGNNTDFPLTKNFVTTSLSNDTDIQVYRNGVYQYSGLDYSVYSNLFGNDIISFTTTPTAADNIRIIESTNTSNIEDITNNFVQSSPTVIANISTLDPSKYLLIFNQGILQNPDSFTYDYNVEELQFTENFTLNSSVRVFAVSNTNGFLDEIYEVDGITTDFPLTYNNISVFPDSDSHIQVFRNGIYQYPSVDYTVSSSKISFTTPITVSDNVFIKMSGPTNLVDVTSEMIQSTSSSLTYTGSLDLSQGTLLVFKDGIIQVGNSYTNTASLITFSEDVSLISDKLSILHIPNGYSIDKPKFIDGIETTFPLLVDSQNINASTAQNCLVYRNGVYQYPGTDYTITSPHNSANVINFTTAPNQSETIFIQTFDTTTGFIDLSADFVQVSSNVLQGNVSILEGFPLLVFVDGIMQVRDSWIYNADINQLTFSEPISGSINIFQINDCPVIVNQVTTSENKTRYPLSNGRKPYYPVSQESLFVCIDGIVQTPGKSYVVEGSDLVFLENVAVDVPLVVIDAYSAGLKVVEDLNTAWSDGDFKYIKTLKQFDVVNPDSVYIIRDGIVQDSNSYDISGNIISMFDGQQTDWENIYIYDIDDQRLDEFGSIISSTNDYVEMKLFKNYQTVSLTTNSVIINVEGIVQDFGSNYEITDTTIKFTDLSFDLYKMTIFDSSSMGQTILDGLGDLVSSSFDGQLQKTIYRLRNTHPELIESENMMIVYGSVVQEPDVDYKIYELGGEKVIEFITETALDLNQLYKFDFSRSSYELIDNLQSLINIDGDNYTVKFTKNYQTISNRSNEDFLVQINGIVQNTSSYNVSGSIITLIGSNYESAVIYDLSGSSFREVDYLSEDFNNPKYKLLTNYSSYTPSSAVDLFILRDQILQNPTEDYIFGTGYIEFTTNIEKTTDIFSLYTHNSEEIIPLLPIEFTLCTDEDTYKLPTTLTESEKNRVILYMNGVPNFYGIDFDIDGDVLSLFGGAYVDENTTPFLIKYTDIKYMDDLENCPDGTKTKFKLLYKGKNILGSSSADILTSRNGVMQNPDYDYVVTLNGNYATFINFDVPLDKDHNTFMVRMYDNNKINLDSIGSTEYNILTPVIDYDNLYVFANGNWMLPTKDYTISGNQINLQVQSSQVFAIEFTGIVKLLDEVHTPYDGTRTTFNLFLDEENFVPAPTVENDTIPDETSIMVIKNGYVLDPKVDYVLSGDSRGQILFTDAPIETDIIHVKAVGSMKKLSSILSGFDGSTRVFNLTEGDGGYDFNVLARDGSLVSTDSNFVDLRTGQFSINNYVEPTDYYPNAEIERPRDHENQIIVIKDGLIQSPIFDYYIDNNKLVFNENVSSSTSKIIIMDFRGCKDDVKVDNRLYQVKVGDSIHLDCSIDEERTFVVDRTVEEIISPTVVKTTPVSNIVYSGFSAIVNYSEGKVTDIVVDNGGTGYDYPPVIQTLGSGSSSFGTSNINIYEGGEVLNTVNIQKPGYNVYVNQTAVASVYGFTYRKQQLTVSNITRATKLTSSITDTTEIIPVVGTSIFDTNPPTIQVTASTGAGAIIRPYVVNGYLRKVEILNGGSGYDERTLEVNVVGGGGSGAVLEPFLDENGTLIDLKIRDHGVGYNSYRSYINLEAFEYTDKTATELVGVTRNVLNYDLSPWEFPLVKNESYIDINSIDQLLVFRNGVHQKPDIDFELSQQHNNCKNIFFKTPVTSEENVFINYFDTNSGFENITQNFFKLSDTDLGYSGTLTDTNILVIIDGVVQSYDSWNFNLTNSVLTFSEPVDTSIQYILFYKIPPSTVQLNKFNMVSGTSTYSLSSQVFSAESLMVIVNGVVQKPYTSYTVTQNDITFSEVVDGSEVNIFDLSSANYILLDDIFASRWINTSNCAIGHKQNDRVYSELYL